VLAGGADLLTPDAAEVAAAIPGARLEVLDGAGHAVAIDAAEGVSRLLRAHLDGRR
jgi:3-oxoadipate enol-lactonase